MTTVESLTAPTIVPVARRRGPLARAEFLNVRATPTAAALFGGSMVMSVASCLASLAVIDDAQLASVTSIQTAMHASTVPTLVFALVAGVVSATSDFRFGRIDQLLLSEPNRSRLFAVKAMVGAATGLVYGVIGAIAAVGATASYYAYRDTPLDLATGTVLRPVIGVAVGAALFAAMGIGVGTAVMNQPSALAGSLAVMLIVEPTVLLGLPAFGKWLPAASGLALTNSPDPNLVAQAPGGLLLVAWTVIALIAGRHRLRTANL